MKRRYMKPDMQVVKIQQQQIICTSPDVKSLNSIDGFILDKDMDLDDV